MPRLLRPYIPLEVRCRVVLRQLGEMWPDQFFESAKLIGWNTRETLDHLLGRLAELLACDVKSLALDHDPALGAREKVFRKGEHVGYRPDANDPEYLIYREKHAHHIKTNVRGDGAQHPDRVLIKKNRRLERKAIEPAIATGRFKDAADKVYFMKRKPRRPIKGRGFSKGLKRSWGKRSFQKRRKSS